MSALRKSKFAEKLRLTNSIHERQHRQIQPLEAYYVPKKIDFSNGKFIHSQIFLFIRRTHSFQCQTIIQHQRYHCDVFSFFSSSPASKKNSFVIKYFVTLTYSFVGNENGKKKIENHNFQSNCFDKKQNFVFIRMIFFFLSSFSNDAFYDLVL